MGWRPNVVDWGVVRLMAAQLQVQSPLHGLWALLTCAAWRTTYYYQCKSSTTSTVVKAPLVRASLVKRRYIKYLDLPFLPLPVLAATGIRDTMERQSCSMYTIVDENQPGLGDSRKASYLFQRIAVTTQCFNSVLIETLSLPRTIQMPSHSNFWF